MNPDPYERSGLREYLTIIKRGWWLVPLTTIVLTGLSYFISTRQEKVFQASSSVFLNFQNIGSSIADIGVAVYSDPVRGIETQANLAQLPVVAARARKNAGVSEFRGGKVTVAPTRNADILTFTATDGDPTVATRLATSYAKAYTDYRRELDTAAIVRARKGIEDQLAELRGDGARRTELYTSLQNKLQQLRTAEALQASNAQVVREAGQALQIQPKPRRNAILAGILGLLLGVGLVFGRNALNTRVRSVDEVRERLRLPLIARVPWSRSLKRNEDGVVMLAEPHSPNNEAYRMLAINLEVANLDRGARSVMVTSAHRGEGKSTTIANLAVAQARRGRHVILVDFDLRAPAVARRFGIEGPGVTDVAIGAVALEDALVDVPLVEMDVPSEYSVHGTNGTNEANGTNGSGKSVLGKLEVLTSGPPPPNAYEFLASPAAAHVLKQLVERADLVLVDAPPILRVSDALSLAGYVDALFAVTRVPRIGRKTLDELKRVLDSAPTVQLGFVATGRLGEDDFGYGYGYGYGYGSGYDGYGYGYGGSPGTERASRVFKRRAKVDGGSGA